jgi:hypothetical protein
MRFDPRRRLERRLPGADVQPEGRVHLHVDEARRGWEDPVPARDQAELRSVTVRAPRQLAQAGPNAPQLIRLIRTPYALAVGRPGRVRIREATGEAEPRPAFAAARAEALADWPEVGSTSAVQPRPRPFAPRPSAAEPIPPVPGARK